MTAVKRICSAAFVAVLLAISAAVYGPGVSYAVSCLPALAAADLFTPEARERALTPIGDEFDLRTTDLNAFYHKLINVNSLFEMACGKRTFPDGTDCVVKLDNDYITLIELPSVTELPFDAAAAAQNVIALQQSCTAQGIPMLFVMPPDKVSKYDPELPRHLPDIALPVTEAFLAGLDGKVPYLDLRQAIHEAGIDQYDFFFRTDHHWNPEGALWSCRYVANVLRRDYGLSFDDSLLAPENFTQTVYPQIFLGSTGKHVGSVVTGADDFTLITPAFDTAFTRTFAATGEVRQGSFEDVLLEERHLRRDYYNENVYSVYMGDTNTTVVNENAPNDTHILLVGDSFRCAFAPFLALTCRQLSVHNPGDSDIPLDEYIRQTRPDIVVVMYYARNMGNIRPFF